MNCDDCLYTDIVEWETLKAKPVYWCERYKKFCSEVIECKYKAESEENHEQTTGD